MQIWNLKFEIWNLNDSNYFLNFQRPLQLLHISGHQVQVNGLFDYALILNFE